MFKNILSQLRTSLPGNLQRGQSLVETTIGFLVFLIILSGLMDMGRLYFLYIAMVDGAAEAALYTAINPSCWDDNGAPTDGICDAPNNAKFRAETAGGQLVDWSSATFAVSPAPPIDGYNFGDDIVVSITYDFMFLTPIMPQIAGINPLPITATAAQTVISAD